MDRQSAQWAMRMSAFGADPMGEQDWGEIYPDLPGTIHRGLGVSLPDDLHAMVHDPAVPVDQRATALLRHLGSPEARTGHDYRTGLGSSWSGDDGVAEDFGRSSASQLTDHNQSVATSTDDHTWGTDEDGDPVGKPATAVMLHAQLPDLDDIDDDPNGDGSGMRYTYHGHGEREVPVRNGAGLNITGISWRPVLPMFHPDYATDPEEYTHHQFGADNYHTAAADTYADADVAEDLQRLAASDELDKSNSRHTSISTTLETYRKAHRAMDERGAPAEGPFIDFGSGKAGVMIAPEIGHSTFEPYVNEGYDPDYTVASKIPNNAHHRLTSLNVLNVLDAADRAAAIRTMGRKMASGGHGVVSVRRWKGDVEKSAPHPDWLDRQPDEPNTVITGGAHQPPRIQHGYAHQDELIQELQHHLGRKYHVEHLPGVGSGFAAYIRKHPIRTSSRRTAMPTWYHLTDNPNFELDPAKHPSRPFGLGEWQQPGVFLTQHPDEWAYGEDDGSWSGERPYLAEFDAPDNLHDLPGVWSDPDADRPGELPGSEETFVPADKYHHLQVRKVRRRT